MPMMFNYVIVPFTDTYLYSHMCMCVSLLLLPYYVYFKLYEWFQMIKFYRFYMFHTIHSGKLYEETNKCTSNYMRCLLTTPTCFGHLPRPSSGCVV